MINNINLKLDDSSIMGLQRYISKIVGNELAYISRPCYYPKMIKYKDDVMVKTGVKDSDISSFVSQLEKKTQTFDIFKDKQTLTLIISSLYMIKLNRTETARLLFLMLAIKFYSSVMHRSFPKFCSADLWKATMNVISPKHLFRVRNGASNTVLYLSDNIFERYSPLLKTTIKDADLIRMVYDLRHRIAQSIHSFAESYYEMQKNNARSTTATDKEEVKDVQLIADKISMSMCTFGQIDKKAFEYSVSRSGLRKDIANSIITELSSVEFKDNIKFILILIGRTSNLKNVCTEAGRNGIIRKIDSGVKFGNYSVKEEMKKTIYNTEIGFRLKTMNVEQLIIFFSNYITLYLKGRIC